jgi:hypothetical protein
MKNWHGAVDATVMYEEHRAIERFVDSRNAIWLPQKSGTDVGCKPVIIVMSGIERGTTHDHATFPPCNPCGL